MYSLNSTRNTAHSECHRNVPRSGDLNLVHKVVTSERLVWCPNAVATLEESQTYTVCVTSQTL